MRLAACVLVVPAAGWCLAVLARTGACVLGPTCVDLTAAKFKRNRQEKSAAWFYF
jgi:hypothetical protein